MNFLEKNKKNFNVLLYTTIGFVIGYLLVTMGIIKTLLVLFSSLIGYYTAIYFNKEKE